MSDKEDFDFFVEQLLDNAVKDFKTTEQYKLLQEKLDQMDRDCDTLLAKDEKKFAVECFELISEVDGQEEIYVYRKAFKDCVSVLKMMGVLA